jgi:hypothetical protein
LLNNSRLVVRFTYHLILQGGFGFKHVTFFISYPIKKLSKIGILYF